MTDIETLKSRTYKIDDNDHPKHAEAKRLLAQNTQVRVVKSGAVWSVREINDVGPVVTRGPSGTAQMIWDEVEEVRPAGFADKEELQPRDEWLDERRELEAKAVEADSLIELL